jgi:uncharacterized protein YkwD
LPHARISLAAVLSIAALALLPSSAGADGATDMIRQMNGIRASHGLPGLRQLPMLNRSAYRFARLLMRKRYFGHASHIHASRRFRKLGEMLELHSGRRAKIGATLRAWLRSPGHRAILLSPSFRYVGVGRTTGRFGRFTATIWVAHLAR